jgi:hypothetical protein
MKVSRGMVGLLVGIALAGCAAVESEDRAVQPAPAPAAAPGGLLSAMLPHQQATLPDSGVQVRWRMP